LYVIEEVQRIALSRSGMNVGCGTNRNTREVSVTGTLLAVVCGVVDVIVVNASVIRHFPRNENIVPKGAAELGPNVGWRVYLRYIDRFHQTVDYEGEWLRSPGNVETYDTHRPLPRNRILHHNTLNGIVDIVGAPVGS
jgi:hypothetical protein